MRTLALLLICSPALAAKPYAMLFRGEDMTSKKACELRVVKIEPEDGKPAHWEDLKLVVNTSYGHGSHGHADVAVETVKDNGKLLETPKSPDEAEEARVRITLKEEENFASLQSFRLDWKHDDHFHISVCRKLKEVEQKE